MRLRSTLAAAVVVAVAVLAAMLLGWWLLRRALTSAAVDAVSARSQEISAQVVQGGGQGLAPMRQKVFGEVIQELDSAGKVLVAAPASASQLRLLRAVPRPGHPLTFEVPALPQSGADEPYVIVARSTRDAATGRTVVVLVGRSVAGLAETVGTVGKLGVAGLPLLVLVAAGATYVFTGRALMPVEDMRQRVGRITSARLAERVPVPVVNDEIRRLAVTMNEMLASLQAAQAAQQRFVADAGHELRSPLATIVASVDVARAEEGSPTLRAEILDNIGAEALRMGRLVDDLLLLARADEQRLHLRMTEVDVDDLVEAEVRRLRMTGQVTVAWCSEPVRVVGDRDRLAQVLRNLAENAQRHAASRVSLDLRREGLHAVLTVEDDGPGVPADARARVFDRFVRLDTSRQRSSGGAGLGLAIVKEIVSGHHGEVFLEPSVLGGTAARVRLPAVGPPPQE